MILGLIIKNEKVVVSSKDVAKNYKKDHSRVLKDIRNLLEHVTEAQANFALGSYKDRNNQDRPLYYMDRQGFSMLVMGFTGEKAKKFTYQYTQAFEEMSQKLQPTGERLIALALIEAQKVLDNKDKLIQEMTPKVEQYETFLSTNENMTMNEVAKVIGYGRNKLFSFLRNKKILMKNNMPYQSYIDRGYFTVRELIIHHSDWQDIKSQTLVTSKGIDYIAKKLREDRQIIKIEDL